MLLTIVSGSMRAITSSPTERASSIRQLKHGETHDVQGQGSSSSNGKEGEEEEEAEEEGEEEDMLNEQY